MKYYFKYKKYDYKWKNSKIFNKSNILVTIFSMITFTLITLNNWSIDKKLNKIQEYLFQNYIFTNTKIQSSIIYLISSEFVLYKLGYELNDSIYIGICIESYIKSYKGLKEDLKDSLILILNYDSDFRDIFLTPKNF